MTSVIDLTERKKAGEELRESEGRYKSQRVASILTCPRVDATSAYQTGPSSRPQMCIMRCGSCPLKPAVKS